ncbi:MAG: hypothetical protein EPN97_05645 [Alphaproteobacteria bacterium]|nr:MAG: hypothetical protein EPN97_05645 [Alphaproteobacteria bacterium]
MTRKNFFWCVAVSLTSLIPYASDIADLNLPIWLRFALLPLAEGMHYMEVFFHEPGHALCHWLFGTPALPVFDVVHGGGMTYSLGRSYALTAFIYALMFSGILLLARAKRRRHAAFLAAFSALHAILIYTGWDLFVTIIMGHGAEIIVGSALLAAALSRPDLLKTRAERCVALATGLHFFGRNALLCAGLLMNAAKRREYAMQKGIPGLGDYQHAGDVVGLPVEAVTAGMLVFLLAAGALTCLYVRRRRFSVSSA